MSGFDERSLLCDGHESGGTLWYRTAVCDGEDAGFVVVEGGKIVKLGVLPAFRRRGVGAALLDAALERIALACPAAALLCRPDNDDALRLYKRAGFQRDAVLRDHYGPGCPALRLVRPFA